MKAAQLKCLAWTFSAFLPKSDDGGGDGDQNSTASETDEDYYHLLGLSSKNATPDDIRRAYKKKSLQLHPDKIAQFRRSSTAGKTDEEIRRDFQRVKEAYDTLSDPEKREVYDALGPVGMKFISNPGAAMDPHVLLDNLSKSTFWDKSKLFVLVFGFIGLCLLQPILICAKVDQDLRGFGTLSATGWILILIPLWVLDVTALVVLAVIRQPAPLVKFLCATVAEVFLALKWDGTIAWSYGIVLIPLYVLEIVRIVDAAYWIARINRDVGRMVTIEYLEEHILGGEGADGGGEGDEEEGGRAAGSGAGGEPRMYADLTEEERDEINKEYIIVHCPPEPASAYDDEDASFDQDERIAKSPEYQAAMALLFGAISRIRDIIVIHSVALVLLVLKADGTKEYSWWVVSVPLWVQIGLAMGSSCLTCCTAGAGGEERELVVVVDDDDDDDNGDGGDGGDGSGGDGKGGKDSDGPEPLVPPVVAKAAGDNKTADGGNTGEKQEKEAAEASPSSSSSRPAASMKASEIKGELESYGIPTKSFLEKGELIEALESARAAAAAESSGGGSVKSVPDAPVRDDAVSEGKFSEEEEKEKADETSGGAVQSADAVRAEATPTKAVDSSNDDGAAAAPSAASDDDSSSSGVYIDEETFRAWQSAQSEEDAKASAVAAKACGNCCTQIFYAMMLALFVAKLAGEDVGTTDVTTGANSYSTFWILFPILLFAGIVLCCCGCSIYCASGVGGLEENVKHMATTTAAGAKEKDGGDEEAPAEAPAGEGGATEAAAAAAVVVADVDEPRDDSAGEVMPIQPGKVDAGQEGDAQSEASDDLD